MENTTAATAQQLTAEQSVANAATNAAASENNALVEGAVKKFTVKLTRVQLFEDADIVNVKLSFDKSIPGFVRDESGDYIAADVDSVSMSRSGLTRALCEHDEMIATVRDGQSTPLTRAQISTILHGATLTLSRTYHAAGFVPEGRDALTRPQWFTEVESVSLSKFAQTLVQQLVMQRMLQD